MDIKMQLKNELTRDLTALTVARRAISRMPPRLEILGNLIPPEDFKDARVSTIKAADHAYCLNDYLEKTISNLEDAIKELGE